MTKPLTPHRGYNVGHPWYFRLGGAIPSPKQIKTEVESRDYRGYLAGDFDAAAAKSYALITVHTQLSVQSTSTQKGC